ncbi:TetR/AcrR family transcriptional regulator [Streptomyces sp. NPDC047000]|uniref:TetR/AcrR family transcriptional regulator n=1 Tax=Streptomyces sp. NPDC047000 TaxID=3155474 RepID=UPI0033DA8F37
MADGRTDGRILRGNQTRRNILRRAVDIASVEGLEGLSIGRLATDLDISKSGVFALFGSKEDLQLATVRAAGRIYTERVITPAFDVPPGLGRVWKLCTAWIVYSRGRTFPGGCFFYTVAAEFDARPGRVREAIADAGRTWNEVVRRAIDDARHVGDVVAEADSEQLTFEIVSFLETSNGASLLHDDMDVYDRAAAAIHSRLTAVAVDPAALDDLVEAGD